jgi:hypothetical protein
MDWSPIDWSPIEPSGANDPSQWLRPQRFFPPEQSTGLEGLFQRTRLAEDVMMTDLSGTSTPFFQKPRWEVLLGLTCLLVLLLGVALGRVLSARNILSQSYVDSIPS